MIFLYDRIVIVKTNVLALFWGIFTDFISDTFKYRWLSLGYRSLDTISIVGARCLYLESVLTRILFTITLPLFTRHQLNWVKIFFHPSNTGLNREAFAPGAQIYHRLLFYCIFGGDMEIDHWKRKLNTYGNRSCSPHLPHQVRFVQYDTRDAGVLTAAR